VNASWHVFVLYDKTNQSNRVKFSKLRCKFYALQIFKHKMLKINVKTQKITADLRGYKADSSPKKRKENKAEKGKGRSLSQCPAKTPKVLDT